jgi:hypothetical protein
MVALLAVTALLSLGSHVSRDARDNRSLLGCWDGCFDAPSLAMIRDASARRSHSFTSVFDRRGEARSLLECAIQSLLYEFDRVCTGTPSDFFVEYWWRDTERIRMLEAHRDIDETLCRKVQSPVSLGSDQKVGRHRCPNFGHVLYVDVENVLAPTLVFEEEDPADDTQRGGPPRSLKTLWSVPAYSNRLLRFCGDCLHAVSYPPLEFLDVPQKREFPELGLKRRAVLLFNTWEKPPLYPVCGEPLVAAEEKLREMHSGRPLCRAYTSWTEADVVAPTVSDGIKLSTLSVPLLGDYSRRGCAECSLTSLVDEEKAVAALTSTSTVFGLNLHSHIDFQ